MTYREANDLIDQVWAESLHQGEKYSPEQIGAFKGILAVRLSSKSQHARSGGQEN